MLQIICAINLKLRYSSGMHGEQMLIMKVRGSSDVAGMLHYNGCMLHILPKKLNIMSTNTAVVELLLGKREVGKIACRLMKYSCSDVLVIALGEMV
jgi:hypothetical protein